MPRNHRKCHKNAWLHIMNKGSNHQNIFLTDDQRYYFLYLLKIAVQRYGAEIHAYCLMSNHYHILIKTPRANISEIMQYIDGNYAAIFNIREKRKGPVFISRYKSIIINSKKYLLDLCRYIHRNPVKANLVQAPQDYPWSSCQFYFSSKKCPSWLSTKKIFKALKEFLPTTSIQVFTLEQVRLDLNEIIKQIKKENKTIKTDIKTAITPSIDSVTFF